MLSAHTHRYRTDLGRATPTLVALDGLHTWDATMERPLTALYPNIMEFSSRGVVLLVGDFNVRTITCQVSLLDFHLIILYCQWWMQMRQNITWSFSMVWTIGLHHAVSNASNMEEGLCSWLTFGISYFGITYHWLLHSSNDSMRSLNLCIQSLSFSFGESSSTPHSLEWFLLTN